MNRHSWIKVQKSGENILRGKAWHRKLNKGRDAQTSYPPKAFRRHQKVKDSPGRILTQKCQRQKEDEDNKGLQGLDLCVVTALWPHLTLSTSSDNSLLSWPRLPLIALVTLRLYFFLLLYLSLAHLNTFVCAAGHLHDGLHPPSSQASAHQEPQRPFPCLSHPTAFLFWTGWTVSPLECKINWLVTVTFSILTPLPLRPSGTVHDCGCI